MTRRRVHSPDLTPHELSAAEWRRSKAYKLQREQALKRWIEDWSEVWPEFFYVSMWFKRHTIGSYKHKEK